MAIQSTTAGPLTAATALYEVSSLLSGWEDLPAPTYVAVSLAPSGQSASASMIVDEPAHVERWAAAFPSPRPLREVYRVHVDSANPGTQTSARFPHPYDERITVSVLATTYDSGQQ